jgi:N-acetylmuramoyl-L-alanine amidase
VEIVDHPSPNFGPRRGDVRPELIVLHYTAMDGHQAALDRLCDPAVEVSAHYLISTDGQIWRLVDESLRAWHAGAGEWRGADDINSRSIGIELVNPAALDAYPPFSEPQMTALEELLREIMGRWSLPPDAVIAHSDLAPARKADPGPKFDWRRLAVAGLAVVAAAPAAADANWSDFLEDAYRFGYPSGEREQVLKAFRLRFRPMALGRPLEPEDVAMVSSLCSSRPGIDGAALADYLTLADGRMVAEARKGVRGKSGLQGEVTAGNARPGKPEGKRHRE